MMMNSKKIIAGLLVLVVLILINVVGNYVSVKFDFTEENLFTLSDGSKSLLSKIEEPVHFEFYFSREVDDLPVVYRNYGSRIENLLGEYVAASNGKVTLEVIEPKPHSDESVRARAMGIRPQETPSGTVFFGLAVVHLGQHKNIPFFRPTPEEEQFLEHNISKLIYSVQQFEKPTLGLYSPDLPINGDQGQPMNPTNPQTQPAPAWMFVQQLQLNYNVEAISAPSDINEAIDFLLVFHPAGVSAEMEFAIDQFILSGRPTLIAVDPLSIVYQQMAPQPQYAFMGAPAAEKASSELPTLFSHYGIQYESNLILGDLTYGEQQRNMLIPIFVSPEQKDFSESFLPISGLKKVSFPLSGSLAVADTSPLSLEPIVNSSTQASLLLKTDVMPALMGPNGNPGSLVKRISSKDKAYTIAGLFKGSLTSAFPDGKPASADAQSSEATQPETAVLAESDGEVQLVVIADTDWLFDGFAFNAQMSRMFRQAVQANNDNYALLANLADYYSGSRDLISIRGKRKADRGFGVVKQIQAEAIKRYENALSELNDELNQVAQELNELQSQVTQSNSLAVGSEMQAAIDEFEAKRDNLLNEQRKIKEKANEDVEREEIKLLVLNIAGIPLMVALFGFIFLFRRHLNK